jgi:hypothetical protein
MRVWSIPAEYLMTKPLWMDFLMMLFYVFICIGFETLFFYLAFRKSEKPSMIEHLFVIALANVFSFIIGLGMFIWYVLWW